MKRYLSNLFKVPKGFTLVELLVVISIIAILSVIGVTIFTSAQKTARDARRRVDIDAISKAFELNKGLLTYAALADTNFASGKVPEDTSVEKYCILTDLTAGAAAPATPSANQWASATDCPTTSATWSVVAPGVGASAYAWSICAKLENSSTPPFYCLKNSQ